MSLNWDVSNIEKFKELCFIPDTIDDKGIIHPDRVTLNPITDVLIWGSMSIGVSRITKKNYKDVRSYNLDSSKLLKTGFKPKKKISDAIIEHKELYKKNILKNKPNFHTI